MESAYEMILATMKRECAENACTDTDFGGHAENCRSFSHWIAAGRAHRGELTDVDRWRYDIPEDAPNLPPLRG